MGDRRASQQERRDRETGKTGKTGGTEAARKDAHNARGEKNAGPYETLLKFATADWIKKCDCAYGTVLHYTIKSRGEIVSVR